MNKRLRLIITILLIVVIAGIIFYPKLKPVFISKPSAPAAGGPGGGPGRGAGGGPGSGGGMQSRQPALNVSGFLIQPSSMNEFINSIGTLKPDEEVELSFETSGKIVGLNFTEGTRVKKGDLLAKINKFLS